MSAPLVEQIANAVLYEGYLLYPYRASAVKNRQRWNFGVVSPQESMETQCLALGGPLTSLSVTVRCLRLVQRVGEDWHEAAECEMRLPDLSFAKLQGAELQRAELQGAELQGPELQGAELQGAELQGPELQGAELQGAGVTKRFAHQASRTEESVGDSGTIVRTQEPLECLIRVNLEPLHHGLFRVGIHISNTTPTSTTVPAQAQALLSAHTILRVRSGEFVSMLETPPEFQEAAAACRNVGTWPVLVGEAGARDTVLSSPIILYDYPQVAPESPGDLFDGAEIDEILSLRILTLTDEEKEEMRHTDDRARRILERTEALPPEHFMKLHGVLRSLHPSGGEAL